MEKRFGMVKGFFLLTAVLMLSHPIIPAVALAETNDEILERLDQLSNTTQEQEKEIERLKKELKESISDIKKQQDKLAGEAIEAEKEETLVKAYRKPKSFSFGGRVQFRFMSMQNDDNHGNVLYQKDFDRPEFDGFCLRRVRLRWQGNITDKWAYHTQISVDGAENPDAKVDPGIPEYELKRRDTGFKLQDAEINYRIHPYLTINMGQFKTRFTNAYLTRGPNLPLCERALIIDKITPPTRDIGISIESEKGKYSFDSREHGRPVYDRPIYYAVGIYNGCGFNHMRNDNEAFMLTGMLLVRPSKYFGFGVSYASNRQGYDYDDPALGSATQINYEGTDYYVFKVGDRKVLKDMEFWDFNASLDMDRVHVQGEYIQRDTDNGTKIAAGYGIQGQLDLFDNFQLTCRYDELDPDDTVDDQKDSQWYTVGFNWFIHGQKVKWQANYTFRQEKYGDDVDNDTLITHFQLLF